MKTKLIVMRLTEKEIAYLRNSTSDLGESDAVAVSLQLKIANAILDSGFNESISTKQTVKEFDNLVKEVLAKKS